MCSFSSVQFSHSVVSDSLQPHESQHARPPCPLPTPGVHWDSRPSSQWCHPAISSSVVPFSSCQQSLPASESFPMCQLFAWGGQSIGISALASVLHLGFTISSQEEANTLYAKKNSSPMLHTLRSWGPERLKWYCKVHAVSQRWSWHCVPETLSREMWNSNNINYSNDNS